MILRLPPLLHPSRPLHLLHHTAVGPPPIEIAVITGTHHIHGPRPFRLRSPPGLPMLCDQEDRMERLQRDVELLRAGWTGHRTQSLFSLPTDESRSSCASPSSFRPRCFSSMAAPIFRVNVRYASGSRRDGCGHGKDHQRQLCGPVGCLGLFPSTAEAPFKMPQHRGPSLHLQPMQVIDFADLTYNNASSIRQTPVPSRTQSISAKSTPCVVHKPQPKNVKVVLQDKVQQKSNGIVIDCSQEGTAEEEQEFYI